MSIDEPRIVMIKSHLALLSLIIPKFSKKRFILSKVMTNAQ